jgi:hypothetical protein
VVDVLPPDGFAGRSALLRRWRLLLFGADGLCLLRRWRHPVAAGAPLFVHSRLAHCCRCGQSDGNPRLHSVG